MRHVGLVVFVAVVFVVQLAALACAPERLPLDGPGCDAGVRCLVGVGDAGDGGVVFCRPYNDGTGRLQPVCVLP